MSSNLIKHWLGPHLCTNRWAPTNSKEFCLDFFVLFKLFFCFLSYLGFCSFFGDGEGGRMNSTRRSHVFVCLLFSSHGPINRPIDWLIDWSSDWCMHWLIDWLTDWLTDRWMDPSIQRLIDWLMDWSIDRLIDWLTDCLTDWRIDWLIAWTTVPDACLHAWDSWTDYKLSWCAFMLDLDSVTLSSMILLATTSQWNMSHVTCSIWIAT